MTGKPGAIILEGHVQGLSNTRSLGEQGIPVYVVDKANCIARYSKYCKKYFRCPDFLSDEFPGFMVNLAKEENIKGWVLIPSNDHAVYAISKHKKILEPFFKVLTPELDIVGKIYDKSQLLKIAEENNIPVPATQYFLSPQDKISEKLKFPLLTKGRHGLSFYKAVGKAAFLSWNEEELRQQLTMIEEKYHVEGSFTQEVIPFDGTNKTVSFTAFCVNGEIRTYWMGVKLREHPLQFGTGTFAKSILVNDCYLQSVPLLRALNYTGVCEVEYLFDPGSKEYKLIEINARTWLWVGLAKFCGVDYAKIIYDFANGREPEYPKAYELDKYWINPVSDTLYALIAMMKGRLNPLTYISSLRKGKMTNALFSKNDLRPGFAYLFKMLSFLSSR
jgi:D-aspartate ligase